jgi:hypothetical protein
MSIRIQQKNEREIIASVKKHIELLYI